MREISLGRQRVSSTVSIVDPPAATSLDLAAAGRAAIARLNARGTPPVAELADMDTDMLVHLAADMQVAAASVPGELVEFLRTHYGFSAAGVLAWDAVVFFCTREGAEATTALLDAASADLGPQVLAEFLASPRQRKLLGNRACMLHLLTSPELSPVLAAVVDADPTVLRGMSAAPEVADRFPELFVRVADASPAKAISDWLLAGPTAALAVIDAAAGRCRDVILDDPAAYLDVPAAAVLVPDILALADERGAARFVQRRMREADLQAAERRFREASGPTRELAATSPQREPLIRR